MSVELTVLATTAVRDRRVNDVQANVSGKIPSQRISVIHKGLMLHYLHPCHVPTLANIWFLWKYIAEFRSHNPY